MKLQDLDFRIWDNTKKEYLYDNPTLVNSHSEGFLIGRMVRQFSRNADHFYQIFRNEFEIELWIGNYDKNGIKIFDGDIIEIKCGDIVAYGYIYYDNKESMFSIGGIDNIGEIHTQNITVIGNIHEDADLLKG